MSLKPWMVCDDFNKILTQHEKVGGSKRVRFSIVLRFTWSNGHGKATYTKEMLDREVANVEWFNKFKKATV